MYRKPLLPLCLLALCLLPLCALALPSTAWGRSPDQRLVVHEWGTFTSVAGVDGVSLDWRPLGGPSDLPSFVYDVDDLLGGLRSQDARLGKAGIIGNVRMETPVLYFYTDQPMDVSVAVSFTQGTITEWYPRLHTANRNLSRVDWGTVRLMPGTQPKLLTEPAPSHYYPARQTDAVPLRVCGDRGDEHEKFLFYRGVGSFPQPLQASLEGQTLKLRRRNKEEIGAVIVFENRKGQVSFSVHDLGAGALEAGRPRGAQGQAALEAALLKVLVDSGLYPKEAQAMVATWRDHWFEEGLRVFYLLPTAETEAMLPLEIEPRPQELVRTLVGRLDIITPEQLAQVKADVLQARGAQGPARQTLVQALRQRQGRWLPVIMEMLKEELPPLDPALQEALTQP
jgi:hypothetical protein